MRAEADFDVQDFEDTESTKGVYAKFYKVAKIDEAASTKEGRPIYVEKDYVEIVAAGNANNIVQRPVTDIDRKRFHRQWEQYKAGDTEQLVGTILAEVPWITRSQVEELNYRRVRTLEQLAVLDDRVCMDLPGVFDLKRKADAYLKKISAAKPFEEMEAKMAEMQKIIDALQAQASGNAQVPDKAQKAPKKSDS